MSSSSAAADIEKFFLVEDPNETGLARDLVNSGAVVGNLVPVADVVESEDEVCPVQIYPVTIILGKASTIYKR